MDAALQAFGMRDVVLSVSRVVQISLDALIIEGFKRSSLGKTIVGLFVSLMIVCFSGATWAQDSGFVSGVDTSRRPAGMPVIKEFKQTPAWRAKALKGVDQPVPEHITAFLKDQGAWYTPFDHAGMLGAYDLRGLHKSR